MIEMLGVLAIIGVLSVGGIAGYSQAMNKFKVTKTTDQIQTLVTNIRTLTSAQRNYKLVDNAALLYKLGGLTDEMCTGTCANSTLINPYGGPIKIRSLGNANKQFSIAYDGLPAAACVSLATQAWGDNASGLAAVVAGTAVSTATAAPATTSTAGTMSTSDASGADGKTNPMSLESASAGCGSALGAVTFFYK